MISIVTSSWTALATLDFDHFCTVNSLFTLAAGWLDGTWIRENGLWKVLLSYILILIVDFKVRCIQHWRMVFCQQRLVFILRRIWISIEGHLLFANGLLIVFLRFDILQRHLDYVIRNFVNFSNSPIKIQFIVLLKSSFECAQICRILHMIVRGSSFLHTEERCEILSVIHLIPVLLEVI